MKTNFRNLTIPSMGIIALGLLSGCGGGGTGSHVIATDLASSYTVTIVESPAGANSMEFDGISPNGNLITGSYSVGSNRLTFRYSNGNYQVVTPADQYVRPYSISDSGTIAATADTTTAQTGCIIFGNTATIYPYDTHEVDGSSYCVDNDGAAYRSVYLDDNTYRSYKVTRSGSTPLTINGDSNLFINSVSGNGWMVGYSGGTYKVYNPTTATWADLFAGQSNIVPRAIGNDGTITGNRKAGSIWVSFVSTGGTVTDYADSTSTYSSLPAISQGGIAVGSGDVTVQNQQIYHGFAWSAASGYVDLNTRISEPNFFISRAYGISDSGKIVGVGIKNGVQVACLLTPVSN